MPAPAEAPLGELEPLRTLVRAQGSDERELLHLRYAADLKFGEIAAVTGQSEAAVKKAIYRRLGRYTYIHRPANKSIVSPK